MPAGRGAGEDGLGLRATRKTSCLRPFSSFRSSVAASCSAPSTRRARWQGFVYSMPGLKDGRPTQWSHMLGVTPGARGCRDSGRRLKLAQRDAAIAHGPRPHRVDLRPAAGAERPLQLRAARRRGRGVRGERLRRRRAARCTGARRPIGSSRNGASRRRTSSAGSRRQGQPRVRDSRVLAAPVVNPSREVDGRLAARGCGLCHATTRGCWSRFPTGFDAMLAADPALALEWRLTHADASSSTTSRAAIGRWISCCRAAAADVPAGADRSAR